MAFPVFGLLDSGTRANEGPPPSANWTTGIVAANGLKIATNKFAGNAAGNNDGYWDVEQFGPDCEVYADVPNLPGSNLTIYLCLGLVAVGAGVADGYVLNLTDEEGALSYYMYRLDNGAFTLLGSPVAATFVANDSLGAERIGADLTVYRKTSGSWASVLTRTDGTYSAAGWIGQGIWGTTPGRTTNFSGGGGEAEPPPPVYATPGQFDPHLVPAAWF